MYKSVIELNININTIVDQWRDFIFSELFFTHGMYYVH